MPDERAELTEYLEKVLKEVQRRSELVHQLEIEVESLDLEIRTAQGGWKFKVQEMQMQRGFIEKLTRLVEKKRGALAAAKENIDRAQERERSVREELKEFT